MAIIDWIKELFTGKNFARVLLAFWWSGFACWVVVWLLTHDLSGSAKEYGNTVLGFIFGVITTVTSFYFGSSQSSTEKDAVIKEAMKSS